MRRTQQQNKFGRKKLSSGINDSSSQDGGVLSCNSSTMKASESRRLRLQVNPEISVTDRVQSLETQETPEPQRIERRQRQRQRQKNNEEGSGKNSTSAINTSTNNNKIRQTDYEFGGGKGEGVGVGEGKGKGKGHLHGIRPHYREQSTSNAKNHDKENTIDATNSDLNERKRKIAMAKKYSKNTQNNNFRPSKPTNTQNQPQQNQNQNQTQIQIDTHTNKIHNSVANDNATTNFYQLCSSPNRRRKLDMIANAKKNRRQEREQQRQNQIIQPVQFHAFDSNMNTNSISNPMSVVDPSPDSISSPHEHLPESTINPQVRRMQITNYQHSTSHPHTSNIDTDCKKDEHLYTDRHNKLHTKKLDHSGTEDPYYSTNIQHSRTDRSGIGRGAMQRAPAHKSETINETMLLGHISQDYVEYPNQSTHHFHDSSVSVKQPINGDNHQFINEYHVPDVSHANYEHQHKLPSDCSYHDEDDDTQFNSVGMTSHHDTSKASASISAVQNQSVQGIVHRESKSAMHSANTALGGNHHNNDDSSHTGSRSIGVGNQALHGICNNKGIVVDDDSTSQSTFHYYGEGDDSVTNGSWTGRMRARQAAEAMVADTNSTKSRSQTDYENLYNTQRPQSSHNLLLPNKISSSNLLERNTIQDSVDKLRVMVEEDSSAVTFTLGVAGAMCGAILMGPVGIIIGVGIGVGVTQVPEEHRKKCAKNLQESAEAANEIVLNRCGGMCWDSNVEGEPTGTDHNEIIDKSRITAGNGNSFQGSKRSSPPRYDFNGGYGRSHLTGGFAGASNQDSCQHDHAARIHNNLAPAWIGTRQVAPACHRMDRITPVNQIHSLEPSLHPRLWLEVMANARTTLDEKNEAMEEILILAKDRLNARTLLEEGILDSVMYIIRDFFQSLEGRITSVTDNQTNPSLLHAKLAANCCVALGKAHCAGFHAEGDVSNMAHITFEAVPVSKQVAQMLFQVPHHKALNKLGVGKTSVAFKLTTDMTMRQAENIAKCITDLSEGNIAHNYHCII